MVMNRRVLIFAALLLVANFAPIALGNDISGPGEEENCSICLSELLRDVIRTSCNHRYHARCFQPLLQNRYHYTCPLCRRHRPGLNPEPECSLCARVFIRGVQILQTTCGHVFHSHCLESWLVMRPSCPHCRSEQLSLAAETAGLTRIHDFLHRFAQGEEAWPYDDSWIFFPLNRVIQRESSHESLRSEALGLRQEANFYFLHVFLQRFAVTREWPDSDCFLYRALRDAGGNPDTQHEVDELRRRIDFYSVRDYINNLESGRVLRPSDTAWMFERLRSAQSSSHSELVEEAKALELKLREWR